MKEYRQRRDLSLSSLDANTSLAAICRLVGHGKTVLDVGCATGYQASLLAEIDCRTTGIELNPIAAEEARQSCVEVHVADVEARPLAEITNGNRFDAVVFGDVLEHLRDPVRLLEQARHVLNEDGFVVASIPNIAHGAIRLSLLQGSFDYQQVGILDDTHLRFFTHKTVEELFWQAGFAFDVVERVTLDVFTDSPLVPHLDRNSFAPEVLEEVEGGEETRTLQFVVRAGAVEHHQRYKLLAQRLCTLGAEIAAAKSGAVALRRQLAAARSAETGLGDLDARLEKAIAERDFALARIDALEGRLAESRQSADELREIAESAVRELERASLEVADTGASNMPEHSALRSLVGTMRRPRVAGSGRT